MKTWHWGVLLLVIAAGSIVWGCTMMPETLGTSSQPISAGDAGSNNNGIGSELWAAWSPSTDPAMLDTLVVGYNVNNSTSGWAWSDDQGTTWHPNTTAGIDAGAGTTFRGDPVMVADHLGNVVYTQLFISAGSNVIDKVITMVSTDGGRTFAADHLAIVNDGLCSDGNQDQPAAAFDYTTSPPTLWVVYRHQASGQPWNMCARRGFLNPANGNRITWLGDSLVVNAPVELFPASGVGAFRVQAGDGAVAVLYGTAGYPQEDIQPGFGSFVLTAVTSFDNGQTWQPESRLFQTDQWAWSVLSNKVQMGANVRNFDFVRAPDGTYYVIAQYSQYQARLFKSRLQAAGTNGNTAAAWSEWCPQTALDDAGASTSSWTPIGVECPQSNWTFVRADPPTRPCSAQEFPGVQDDTGELSCTIAWPTIAADDQNRLAISYYESDDTNRYVHVRVWSNPMPRTPTSSWSSLVVPLPSPPVVYPSDDDSGVDFDPLPPICADAGGCGTRSMGDYEGHTVRLGTGAPACGSQGTFFPFWTLVNPPDVPFAQTVSVAP